MTRAVLVPLRSFHDAKSRLRDATDTASLSRTLAAAVFSEFPNAIVVSDDDAVVAFAHDHGHAALSPTRSGLSASLARAIELLPPTVDQVLIVHADLAQPHGLANFHPHADVCVVSDQRGDGTPVLFLPRHCEFVLHYGPHSARRHLEEAGRRGLSCQIVSGSPWGIDIDEPEDLSLLP